MVEEAAKRKAAAKATLKVLSNQDKKSKRERERRVSQRVQEQAQAEKWQQQHSSNDSSGQARGKRMQRSSHSSSRARGKRMLVTIGSPRSQKLQVKNSKGLWCRKAQTNQQPTRSHSTKPRGMQYTVRGVFIARGHAR